MCSTSPINDQPQQAMTMTCISPLKSTRIGICNQFYLKILDNIEIGVQNILKSKAESNETILMSLYNEFMV